MPKNIALVIAVASNGRYVPLEWSLCFASLAKPMNMNYAYFTIKGMETGEARNYLVQKALDVGSKYIFFIDDDTAPPAFALDELIYVLNNADDDVIFCAGIYCTKTNPPAPTISQGLGLGPFWKWKTGDVFEMPYVGTGCMLIKTEIFSQIEKPWFKTITSKKEAIECGFEKDDEDMSITGEYRITDDFYFCKKVADIGKKGMAHGGVLPVHFDSNGNIYPLPIDSYPIKNGRTNPQDGFGFKIYYTKEEIEKLSAEETTTVVSKA
jgi:hypothetical protein